MATDCRGSPAGKSGDDRESRQDRRELQPASCDSSARPSSRSGSKERSDEFGSWELRFWTGWRSRGNPGGDSRRDPCSS